MNKSKFLKRSLATLLAILMVVAMVPMSAFAAVVIAEDVPTARNDAENPGYEIAINGYPFTWNGTGYEAAYSFVNDNSGTLPTVQLSMTNVNTTDTSFILTDTNQPLTLNNLAVNLDSAKKKTNIDAYGAGTYEFTLETRKELGQDQEIKQYPLIINVTVRQLSADTLVRGVRSAKMPKMVTYNIEPYDNGGGKITISMTLDVDVSTTQAHVWSDATTTAAVNGGTAPSQLGSTAPVDLIDGSDDTAALKGIFAVSPLVTNMSLHNKKLTVTAENGHTDTYDIVLKNEQAFTTFSLKDNDDVEYVGTVDADNPKTVIIDLPYDKFYEDDSDTYAVTPDPNDTAIVALIDELTANWTTNRDEAVVNNAAAGGGSTIKSGDTKWTATTYDARLTTAAAPTLNRLNKSGNDRYLIFKRTVSMDTNSKVYAQYGNITVYVRVPAENPSTTLEGIQIKGENTSTGAGSESTANGSEKWSQYEKITNNEIKFKVPYDVLQPSVSLKENEKGNSRAYIKLWGAYGAQAELPWDFVSATAATDPDSKIEANGFDTTVGGDDDTLRGSKEGAITTSDSTILLTEINRGTAVPKRVEIDVTSQDGENTARYFVTVESTKAHPTGLKSVTLYDADGEVAGKTTQKGQDYEIEIPYALGSGDGAPDWTKYTIEAIAEDGARISYADGDRGSLVAADFNPFVKDEDVQTLVGSAGLVAKQLTGTQLEHLVVANNQFTLRVWDKAGIAGDGNYVDHTITFTMPAPDTQQRVVSAEMMATDTADGKIKTDSVMFNTVPDNRTNTITVTLPYAYKALNEVYFSELTLGGTGARLYWEKAGKLEKIKTATKTVAGTQITTANGADWWVSDKEDIKVYVVSEDAYSRAKHERGTDLSGGTATKATVDGWNDFKYYTEYKLTAAVEAAQRGNSLNSITADDEYVTVAKDDNASTITVTVPYSYANSADSTNTNVGDDGHAVPFNLDFTLSDKARFYMNKENDSDGDKDDAQVLNDGIPAEGITYFPSRTAKKSRAIIPETNSASLDPTMFWVYLDTTVPNVTTPRLMYHDARTESNDNNTTAPTGMDDDREAAKAMVAAEYSKFNTGNPQEDGGTRPFTIKTVVAPAETDPAITGITVMGRAATLSEDADGNQIYTVSLPYRSDPAQQLDIKTAGNFTKVTVDGEEYDPEAYYILFEDVTLLSTPEDGSRTVPYTLRVVYGDVSSNTNLAEVRVDGYTATLGNNNTYTVMPADTADLKAMSLNLRAADENIQGITVNGAAYTPGMTVDLSEGKAVTIIVTAQDGTQGTYTLTVGEAPIDKPSDHFTDLDQCSNSLKNEVARAIDMGIVKGTGDNKYSPKAFVRRVDFAVMIARADLIANGQAKTADEASAILADSVKNSTPFTDIASLNNEQKAAIEYCYDNKYISGTSDTTFGPTDSMTREMAAKVITVWSGTTVDTNDKENHTKFTSDWNKVGNWAKPYVNSVATTGLMNGTGATTFNPQGKVTREMAAALLVRVFDQKYPTFGK